MREQSNPVNEKVPEIYCSLSICFDKSVDIDDVLKALCKIGITTYKIHTPKCEPVTVIELTAIYYEPFWELNDALSKLFIQFDNKLVGLKAVVSAYEGEAYVDIAIAAHGSYPTLFLERENVGKISYLNAGISIDLY